MNVLLEAWNSFSPNIAHKYLKTFGYPSLNSKKLLADIIKIYTEKNDISVIDLGCGNAQLYSYFKENNILCRYTGVDFSKPLLQVAQKAYPEAVFINDDIENLTKVNGKYDVVIYSHVIEMLSSPELSLSNAIKLAPVIIIRFFEPPEFQVDTVEIKEMDVGKGSVTYIRRKMSKDYYCMILAKINCKRVDIYRDHTAKDQIHILHF